MGEVSEPTTAAGRHFRDVMNPYVVVPDGWWGDMGPGVENLVARIEAEAAAAARTTLLDELEAWARGLRATVDPSDPLEAWTDAALNELCRELSRRRP